MNSRLLLSTFAFAATAAILGVAHAATPAAAHPPPVATNATTHHPRAERRHHTPHRARHHLAHAPRTTAMDRLHRKVVAARSAEQQRWIASELRHGQLVWSQADALRSWLAQLNDQQRWLTRRGHETVDEALAISHEEDLLDWSIRTGHTEYRPQRLVAMA